MSKWISLTNNRWLNLEHVIMVEPFSDSGEGGVELTFINNHKQRVRNCLPAEIVGALDGSTIPNLSEQRRIRASQPEFSLEEIEQAKNQLEKAG